MMASSVRRLLAVTALLIIFLASGAQQAPQDFIKKETRPYKLLSSGKEITLKSSQNILHVMVWTVNGHRVVEQKEINAASFTFKIPINDKIFFLMVGLEGGRIYTEKIGVE